MYFDATPLNLTTILVIALAIVALVFLFKGRYDSNLPLLFYGATLVLIGSTERSLSAYLLLPGLAFALLLRFEFMGKGVTKFVGVLTTIGICLVVAQFLNQVFGDGRDFF
jgi:hypothetical protein